MSDASDTGPAPREPHPRVDVEALLSRVDIVEVVGRYVGLTKSGAEYEACCPFHAENTPSFKVNPSRQFYYCFGCGAHGNAIGFLRAYNDWGFLEAVEALGGAPASAAAPPADTAPRESKPARTPWVPILPAPADAPAPPAAHYARGHPQNVWTYRDAEGRVLGYTYRFTKSDGGKEVLPVVWARNADSGAQEWRWMSFPEPRPLYGLNRLAAKPDAAVLLVEGEKCADAGDAELPDHVVMSWPGGGKADGKVDWSPLAGRRVVTWADADAKREKLTPDLEALGVTQESQPILPEEQQPGFQTMARIREHLRSLGCKLWDIKLPPPGSKSDGWDIADAVLEGLRGKDLAHFIRTHGRSAVPQAPRETPEQIAMAGLANGTAPRGKSPESRHSGDLLVDAVDWLANAPPMEWVVDGLIMRGNLYACTATTNHGKTAIGLLMAMSVALGVPFAEMAVARGKVLILCGENPDGFRTRLHATLESMGYRASDIAGRVTVLPQALPLGPVVEQIVAEARRQPGDYGMVMVDTSISFFTGDNEDDNLQARSHAWHLRALCELPGRPAILCNTHPTKNADRDSLLPRGGGAFLNEIDTNLTVWAEGEAAQLHWYRKKRGPDFDPIPFEFHGATIEEFGRKVPTVYAAHITEAREREIARARSEQEDQLLLAMLRRPDGNYVDWANAIGLNGVGGKSQIHRVMKQLQKDGLVKDFRRRKVLTTVGEGEAKRAQY